MTIKYTITNTVDSETWNNELQKSDYATFFQTAEYLTFESNMGEKIPFYITIQNEDKVILGQLGLFVIKSAVAYSSSNFQQLLNKFAQLGRKALWAGGPIIHTKNKDEKQQVIKLIISALNDIAKKNNLALISGYTPHQDFSINSEYFNEFTNSGYAIEKFFTFATDLTQDKEKIWNSIQNSTRRDVTRSEKKGIIVKELENHDELKKYFLLNQAWAKTKGIETSISDIQIDSYWKYYKSGKEKIFLAYNDDELVSSHRLGCFNGIIYSHKLVSSYSKPASISGPLLVWKAIEWAKEKGMKFYDYSGGMAPPNDPKKKSKYEEQWGSLLAFKRKWGGEEYPYYQLIKVTKPNSYKMFRALSKPDWIYRNFKKKKYTRPSKTN